MTLPKEVEEAQLKERMAFQPDTASEAQREAVLAALQERVDQMRRDEIASAVQPWRELVERAVPYAIFVGLDRCITKATHAAVVKWNDDARKLLEKKT